MAREYFPEDHREDGLTNPGSSPASECGTPSPEDDPCRESSCPIERIVSLQFERGNRFVRASQLLASARDVFEPLFRQPPLGPIPDHLQSHWRIYGCVADYEESVEEIERWKEERLDRWLRERIGHRWRVDGHAFELIADTVTGPDAPAYTVKALVD